MSPGSGPRFVLSQFQPLSSTARTGAPEGSSLALAARDLVNRVSGYGGVIA